MQTQIQAHMYTPVEDQFIDAMPSLQNWLLAISSFLGMLQIINHSTPTVVCSIKTFNGDLLKSTP